MTVNSSGSRTQKVYSRHIPLPPNHKSQSFNTASNSQVPRKLQLIHNCQNLQTFPDSSPGWPLVLSQHMDHYLSVIIWTKWGPLTKIWTRYGPRIFLFCCNTTATPAMTKWKSIWQQMCAGLSSSLNRKHWTISGQFNNILPITVWK